MIKKDILKIKLIATILFIVIISTPFTSATGIIISPNKVDKINQIQINTLNYVNDFKYISATSNIDKSNIEKSLAPVHLFIKFLILRFYEYPKLTALCQQILSKLDILGRDWSGFTCTILIAIYLIIDEISYYLLYDLGFPILGNIISIPLIFIDKLFASHCSWMFPYYLFSIQNIRIISDQILSTKKLPCRCIYQ